MNLGSCLPQMWGLRVGRFADTGQRAKTPPYFLVGFMDYSM